MSSTLLSIWNQNKPSILQMFWFIHGPGVGSDIWDMFRSNLSTPFQLVLILIISNLSATAVLVFSSKCYFSPQFQSIVSLWLGQDSPRSIKRLSWGKLVFQAGSTLHWHYNSASWILCYNTHNIFQFGFKLSSYYKISQVWSSMFFSGPASRVSVSYGVRMDQISLRWKMILTWQLK